MTVTSAAPADRIFTLDVLRGIALFGMYVVHFGYYTTPADSTADRFVERGVSLFFVSQFWTLFSILFGVGFAVLLSRAAAREQGFGTRYLRRLAMLGIIGVLTEMLFGYRVLLSYAIWGLPLLFIGRWPVRRLVILTLLCAVAIPVYRTSVVTTASARGGDKAGRAVITSVQARSRAMRAGLDSANQSRDWTRAFAGRLRYIAQNHGQLDRFIPSVPFVFFLLGVLAFRLGLFIDPLAHRRLIISAMVFGVASWILGHWLLPALIPSSTLPKAPNALAWVVRSEARRGFGLLFVDLALTYAGAIMLLLASKEGARRWLAPFEWTGRMALTHYVLQLIVLTFLFERFPGTLGLRMSLWMSVIGAAALLVAQALISQAWLARFRFGPLEWLWRSVTYWRAAAPCEICRSRLARPESRLR